MAPRRPCIKGRPGRKASFQNDNSMPSAAKADWTRSYSPTDAPPLVTFRKAAYVDIGPLRALNEGWQAEIGWQAASLAPLFPVFAGTIVIRSGELTLSGSYAPPGGVIGRAADRALLHIAAEGTARWFLARVDEAAALGGVEG